MPDPFVPLGDAAAGVVAGLAGRRAAAAHPNAEVIDLAGRVERLIVRERRVSAALGRRELGADREIYALPALPPAPRPVNRTRVENSASEGWYTTVISYPTTPDVYEGETMVEWQARRP